MPEIVIRSKNSWSKQDGSLPGAKTAPQPTTELRFPAFIYGEKTSCRRKMKAEAKKWTKCYLEGKELPVPKLAPIAPGSVVYTDASTADLVALGYNFIPNANAVIIDGG